MVIGRTATFLSFVLGIALVPLLDNYQSIFAAINDIIAHIAPPITCVFMLGVFWKGASAASARLTMWIGSALGALLFALKTLHLWQPERFAWVPPFFYETPFMLMAFYLLVLCVVLQVSLSLVYRKGPEEDRGEAVLGASAGRLEVAGLARAGQLQGPVRGGVRGDGGVVCDVPLQAAIEPARNSSWSGVA